MITMGLMEYTFTRRAENSHQVRYYKRAPVTPAQSYAAAAGFTVLGAMTVVTAILHGRCTSNGPQRPPGEPASVLVRR